jgi:hypothetical protein
MCLDSGRTASVQSSIGAQTEASARQGIVLRVMRNFDHYVAIRRAHGGVHLNQAFDARTTEFNDRDFWILAENITGEAVGTYCLRHFAVENFYTLVTLQSLWFNKRPPAADPRFIVRCEIPAFGGHVTHGGGLWVRRDYRGWSRLSNILPRLARAIALSDWSLDHDSAMIRDDPRDPSEIADRKARSMGLRAYGFARVGRFVNGWFPPENRDAIMHLCHSTREEVVASLAAMPIVADEKLRVLECQVPLVYEHQEVINSIPRSLER